MDYVFYVFLFMTIYWMLILYIDNVASKAKMSSEDKMYIVSSYQDSKSMKEIAYYTKTNFVNQNIKNIKDGDSSNGK